MKPTVILFAFVVMCWGCGTQRVTDADDNTYKTVQIGNQLWMAENLNVSHFRNGDPIPHVKTDEEWERAGDNKQPAWCYYDNDPAHGEKYGKMYNWYAANDSRGIAPKGWHVPSDAEWTALANYLGGRDVAGTKMRTASGWNENGDGTNESGFSGLPGGGRDVNGSFYYAGYYGSWWSSTQSATTKAWTRNLGYNIYGIGSVYRNDGSKGNGLSVRCLRD
ncbi:MAG TPA: hypothetical protein EYN71_04200 [Flavobacteriales bacterium]|nr:hypothetical protein [Flavobacteriales bacterium]HIO67603.1 hypothetical protein [Flavobacteriales bacterium]